MGPIRQDGQYAVLVSDRNDNPIQLFGVDHMLHQTDDGRAALWLRAPMPESENGLPHKLTVLNGGIPVSQTTLNGAPPVADAGDDQVLECTGNRSAPAWLDASGSSDADGDTLRYQWSGSILLVDPTVPVQAVTLPMGNSDFTLTVTDGLSTATDSVSYRVVDTTPPEVQQLPRAVLATCDTQQTFTLVPPTAVDRCTPAVTVTGYLITRNGSAVQPPVALSNHSIALGPGEYRIEWRARDEYGNTGTSVQDVLVRAGVRATRSITLADRTHVRSQPSGNGTLWNSGTGAVELGRSAVSGSITSTGSVFLRDYATVYGNIRTQGSYTRQNNVNVTGTIQQHVASFFPGLYDDSLASVVFPPPGGDSLIFNPRSTPYRLAPGSYRSTTLNSGATVELSQGDYYFTELMVNSASKLVLGDGRVPIRLYTANKFDLKSSLVDQRGAVARAFVGHRGTDTVMLETEFMGTLLAPNARVTVGTTIPLRLRGRVVAADLETRPDVELICDLTAAP
jgi:hypothetical protein